MQDGKALQAGTSHFLGQNFAKAFDVKFADKNGKLEHVWATSWGVSTRLMGALIMAHSDDNGLILPPKIAPVQVIIIPIYKAETKEAILNTCNELLKNLKLQGVRAKLDDDDNKRPGFKFAEYELKGVPIRLAMGENDLKNQTIELVRRDTKTKESLPFLGIEQVVATTLEAMQQNIFDTALAFRNEHITEVNSFEEFKTVLQTKTGFLSAHWDGTPETEEKIKELTKATIRCIPLQRTHQTGSCVLTGKPSAGRVFFAKAY